MPELLFFLPSESCSIDAGSNRISVFHICEQLNLTQFPGLVPNMCFISLWEKTGNEDATNTYIQTIELIDPDGTALCKSKAAFQLQRRRHRLISIVNNIRIHRAGMHRIIVHGFTEGEEKSDATLIKSFPIEVQQIQNPKPAA
jgi:hypothetical protein